MASVYELKNKRTQYYNLRYSLQLVSDGLSKSINKLENPSASVNQYYQKNNEGYGKTLSECKRELIEKRNEILNVIIPQIDTEIYNLGKKITEESLKNG